MGKGESTRQAILEGAVRLASQVGLEGLTIGGLSKELRLSKSGLFAHFESKESLQVETLRYAAERFVEIVVRPALSRPRGEPRIRALFQGWLEWGNSDPLPGGCLFLAAATELDDRPGPARDELVSRQKDWLAVIATSFRLGVQEGDFRGDVDPDQFAYELQALILGYAFASRLLGDKNARKNAEASFEALLARSRQERS